MGDDNDYIFWKVSFVNEYVRVLERLQRCFKTDYSILYSVETQYIRIKMVKGGGDSIFIHT